MTWFIFKFSQTFYSKLNAMKRISTESLQLKHIHSIIKRYWHILYSNFYIYSLCFLVWVGLSGNKGMSQEGSNLPKPNPPRHILLLVTSRLSFFKSKLMIWLSPLFILMVKALRTSCSRAPLANNNSTNLGLFPFSQT